MKCIINLISILILLTDCSTTRYPGDITRYPGDITLHTTWYNHAQEEALDDLAQFAYHSNWKYYFTDDGISWQINLEDFSRSKLASDLQKLVDRTKFSYQNTTGRILRRGQNVKINQICKDEASGVVLLLFLAVPSEKNDYGEIMFFSEPPIDILATIRATTFSVITFPCQLRYQWQYPAIATQRGIIFVQMLFTDSEDLVRNPISDHHLPFPDTSGLYYRREEEFNIKMTKSFNLTEDKPVFVIDDLFEKSVLDDLRSHFLQDASYGYNEIDEGGYSDNVVFITPQFTFDLAKTKIWAIIEQTVEQVTGVTGWYPYDVSTNLNMAWDHTRIHPDCFGREEYTFLLYLNPSYKPGDLGGTVWYTEEDGETIIGSVMNKYGRVALFHCSIPHAARPPQAYVIGPRLSFAVKVSTPKSQAVIRAWSETRTNQAPEEENDTVDIEDEKERELIEMLEEYKGDVTRFEKEFEKEVLKYIETVNGEYREILENIGSDIGAKDEL